MQKYTNNFQRHAHAKLYIEARIFNFDFKKLQKLELPKMVEMKTSI